MTLVSCLAVDHGCSPVEGNASLVAELGSGGNQPTAGAGSAVSVGLRTQCWVAGYSGEQVAGTSTHGNPMVSPGDVLGRSDPLMCGNDDYIVLEGAQATVRPLKRVSSQTPNSYLGRPAVSLFWS